MQDKAKLKEMEFQGGGACHMGGGALSEDKEDVLEDEVEGDVGGCTEAEKEVTDRE